MFGSSCTGCVQVPTPIYYWGPYAFPATFGKKSFNINDIIQASHEYHKNVPSVGLGIAIGDAHPPELAHVSSTKQNIRAYSSKSSDDTAKRIKTLTLGFRAQLIESDSETTEAINYSTKVDRNIKCSVPSALEPLQALCRSELRGYEGPRSICSRKTSTSENDSSSVLKFGMNRILSDDFGKEDRKSGKENAKIRESQRPCECTIDGCHSYQSIRFPSHALTAVHALQPPKYPSTASGSDTLPGPYSVLNTEVNIGSQSKRKRSWSRAVFSNLQRKGLEKRFEVQKYVTKPDRRQLAAMLGLTDAQVKVWFQNRRMKWRHAQQCSQADSEMDCSEQTKNEITGSDENEHPEANQYDYTNGQDSIVDRAEGDSESDDEIEDKSIVVVNDTESSNCIINP